MFLSGGLPQLCPYRVLVCIGHAVTQCLALRVCIRRRPHTALSQTNTTHEHFTYLSHVCRHTQANIYVLTHCTYAAPRFHTQTHILGHFSCWHSSTALSKKARWIHSVGCWPFNPQTCFLSFLSHFLPFSSTFSRTLFLSNSP